MKKLVKPLVAILAIALIGYFISTAAAVLRHYDLAPLFSRALLGATALMALCYGFAIPLAAWGWHRLLACLGETRSISELGAIMAATQFAKYVPGNFAHIAGRSALSLARGISGRVLLLSLTLESLLAVFASIMVGTIGFALATRRPSLSAGLDSFWLAVASLVAALVVLPWAANLFHALTESGHKGATARVTFRASQKCLGLALVAYAATYLFIGLGLWVVARAIGATMKPDYWYLTATFALAWAAGFLVPGAPAGLGVRESVMMWMLSDVGREDGVLVLVTAARVATMAADILWFSAGLFFLRRIGGSS